MLQGSTGTCTELTSSCSSSSQNKLRTSALKLAVLTACHLHVIGGQHRPYSCPPAAHATKAGDAPSQAGKGSTGSCNTCHLPQGSFKTLPHIPCFTTTVLPPGKAERLLPSAQHWAGLWWFSLKFPDAPFLAFGAYSLAMLRSPHFCGDNKTFYCYAQPSFHFALERHYRVERQNGNIAGQKQNGVDWATVSQ